MDKVRPPQRTILIRFPKPIYDRLLRRKTSLSIKGGRSISLNSLVVEAVEQTFTKVD